MKLFATSAAIALLSALALSACTPATNAAQPVAVTKAEGGKVTAKGSFRGENNHIVTGKAKVSKVDGQWVITLDEGFLLDGAPDPKVALGNGQYVQGTILGELKSLKGKQSYVLPTSLNIGDYNQVYIWCEQFSVSLGVADLELI